MNKIGSKCLQIIGQQAKKSQNLLKNQQKSFKINRQCSKFLSNNFVFQFSSENDKYSQQTMDQLKQQAEQFYQNEIKETSTTIDIQNVEHWKTEVMQSQIPIILHCHADFSEACREIDPVLVKKAEELKNKLKYVKLDIDKNADIATALQVKAVPTVFLIHGANAIDGFQNSPDEKVLNKFFSSIDRVCGLNDEQSEIISFLTLAQTFIESNNSLQEAQKVIQDVLSNEKWKNKFGARCYALLTLMHATEGNKSSYKHNLSELNTKFSEEAKEQEIQDLIKLAEQKLSEAQDISKLHPFILECQQELEKDENNHQVRYELAEYQFNNEINEEAIDNCLYIIKKKRNWEDKKAQSLLITVFEQLGSSNELSIKGRQRLQRLLF